MCKSLSREYEEVMKEIKALAMSNAVETSISCMDEEITIKTVKETCLMNRVIDLCGDILKRQDELLEKMNKILERYPRS